MKVLLNADPHAFYQEPSWRRIDYIVIDEAEFLQQKDFTLAFRGDDRPPHIIFTKGFSYRASPFVHFQALLNSNGTTLTPAPAIANADKMSGEKLKEIMNFHDSRAHAWEHGGTYAVEASEVVFRVPDFDLAPSTCTSLTLDFETASQFPYNKVTEIYIYLMYMADINWLPTHLIQVVAPRQGLNTCREITCKKVPPGNILGAIKILRPPVSGAGCKIDFKITDLIPNSGANPYSAEDLLKILQSNFPDKFSEQANLETCKQRPYHYDCAAIGMSQADTANAMLRRALQTFQLYLKPEGSIEHLLKQIPSPAAAAKPKCFGDDMVLKSKPKFAHF